MAVTGEKLLARLGSVLRRGRRDLGLRTVNAAATRLPGAPDGKTLEAWEAGEGVGARALGYAVQLARRAPVVREGILEIMGPDPETLWFRTSRENHNVHFWLTQWSRRGLGGLIYPADAFREADFPELEHLMKNNPLWWRPTSEEEAEAKQLRRELEEEGRRAERILADMPDGELKAHQLVTVARSLPPSDERKPRYLAEAARIYRQLQKQHGADQGANGTSRVSD